MKRTKLVILSLLSLFVATNVVAQSSNDRLIKLLVEKSILSESEAEALAKEAELERKEAAKPKTSDETKPANPFVTLQDGVRSIFPNVPWLKVGGYGLLMYQFNDANAQGHNFRPRLVMLSAEGRFKNFRFFILGDVVNPTLYDYYAEWMVGDYFNLRAGQYKLPFSLENQISLTQLETVLNTRSVAALSGMAGDVVIGNHGAGRDIGIQAAGKFLNVGDHNLFEYAVGVFQGAGINASDNNKVKDVVGSIAIQPVKGWKISGSIYEGQSPVTVGAVVENQLRRRFAAGSEYTSERVYARAEWLYGIDGATHRAGAHAMGLYYFIPKKLNALAKVDFYNRNMDLNATVLDCHLGVNYYFAPSCRVMLNYTLSRYSDEWLTAFQGEWNVTPKTISNAVTAQVQIVF